MSMGNRIKTARENLKWTQLKLSEVVCALAGDETALSQQALHLLETRDSATSTAAPYIAEALSVSLRWLLTGAGRSDDVAWPFQKVRQSRWEACSDEDRGYVQHAINRALDECEASRRSTNEKQRLPLKA